jgi:CheY-like chemotaxis protein
MTITLIHHQKLKNSNKKLILVIDDSEVCQQVVKLMLLTKAPYYKILSAYNGSEALEKAQLYSKDIAIILLDNGLPDIPGSKLYSMFQSNPYLKQIPVIFQSGNKIDIKEFKINNQGKIDIFLKPFNPENLFKKIKNLVEKDIVIKPLPTSNKPSSLKRNTEKLLKTTRKPERVC